jgi:Tol biopolymer transport system component
LGACQYRYHDVSKEIVSHPLSFPEGQYGDIAWVNDDQLVIQYAPEHETSAENRLKAYSISDDNWIDIQSPSIPEECLNAWPGKLGRLPDGALGFIFVCPGGNDPDFLYRWDNETGLVEKILEYPKNIFASTFAFSPDMSVLLQEDANGPYLSNRIIRILTGGEYEPLFRDFRRAMSPSWSPDGKIIAFFGTKTYPREQNGFDTWNDIEALLRYPWDIYFMDDASGGNLRIAVRSVSNAGILKWSPTDNILAFLGIYLGKKGIWLYNPATSQMTRIWGKWANFDWSPDGRRMFLLEEGPHVSFDEVQNEYPSIIDIPEELLETPK